MGRTITDIIKMFFIADEEEVKSAQILKAYNEALKPSNYIKQLEGLFYYKSESSLENLQKKLEREKKDEIKTTKPIIIKKEKIEKDTQEKEIGE